MKRFTYLLCVMASVVSAFGQPREGKRVELGISGAYQNYSSGSSSNSSGAFLISPRVGVYVAEGFALEPEVTLLLASNSDPAYVFSGNVVYNFLQAGKGVPFILVGYGVANSVPLFGLPVVTPGFTVGVLNLGAGVKVYLLEDVALRIEYRYQNFSGEDRRDYGFVSFTQKLDTRIHSVQFGLSVLL